MLRKVFLTSFGLILFIFTACSSETGIFPAVDLSTKEASASLPNPISIVTDPANEQLVVANSNIDILYDTGSLAVLHFDATDTDAPELSAEKLIATPNFASDMYFDGVDAVYIPFRESYSTDDAQDTLVKYTLGEGTIAKDEQTTVKDDPFGIVGDGVSLFVVSDDYLSIYDAADLHRDHLIDLSVAEDEGLDDVDSSAVMSVAVNAAGTRAFVSNTGGSLFVVDLETNELVQAVSWPTSSRNLMVDGDRLYVLDGVTETLMIFNLTALDDTDTPIDTVDESEFLLATVTVGNNPYGLALDAANNRLYVANMDDDSLSVIDTQSFQELTRISLAQDDISDDFKRDCDQPFALALDTYNGVNYVFAACLASHDVVVVNTDTLKVVEVYPNTVL